MALSMHTNYASLVTQNTLNNTGNLLNTAMERLSTGYRINSAADDAAGLQISTRLESQTRGMKVAMRNAQDGISMMQTAEGAMDEMTNIIYRMKDLATQASNGSASKTDKAALNKEYQQLNDELVNIKTSTNFGGQKLFDTTGFAAGPVNIQIGTKAGDLLSIDVSKEIKDGISKTIGDAGKYALGKIDTEAGAQAALTKLTGPTGDEGLLAQIGSVRSSFGANINRLDHTIVNLGNMVENTSAAKGRITDTDFAVETSNMTKNQLLMQAGTSVLTKTNQLPTMAISLLN
ncbi:Lateral flagellin [Vibrio mimicus]|uniref:lateral flagellin LafA n=1 Tax=Vibrio mimicus TaxID=674 RepID=UPI000878DDF8|nr:lateral flagellin LafA [Vibrio mimicus]AOW84920.1 Lateral flagellin [Vibrio mimicus]TXZ07139.1 Lateral flagellin [Vibrio mimicus]TXZ75275.1 Lateral flagellin [Vibrio mimicus]